MTANESNQFQLTPAQRQRNRIKLLILWLVPFGLMAIAGVCYYLVNTGQLTLASKNNGDLIRPAVQLKEVFAEAKDASLREVWDDKWSMVIRVIGHCDEHCRQSLYLSRQIHIRLDKQANRVQRVMLVDNALTDPAFLEFLEKEHTLLKVIDLSSARGSRKVNQFDQVLQETVAATNTQILDAAPQLSFFLVDQSGFAMMTYHQGHAGNDILQDMKHLLKFSRGR